MISGEAVNANVIVFGVIPSGIEPTIYHTPDQHALYYTTRAVFRIWNI